jgi:hypothetical protein
VAGHVGNLSAYLESGDSRGGRRRVAQYLERQPLPHYEPHPDKPGVLVNIDANGARVPQVGDSERKSEYFEFSGVHLSSRSTRRMRLI